MLKSKIRISALVSLVFCCLCLSFTAFAEDSGIFILDMSTFTGKQEKSAVTKVTKLVGTGYSGDDYELYFKVESNILYMSSDLESLSRSRKNEVIQLLFDDLAESKMSTKVAQAVYYGVFSILGDNLTAILPSVADVMTPDILPAYMLLLPFKSAWGTLLGVLAVFLVISLGVVTVWDIFYLALPDFRVLMDTKAGRGEGKPPYGVSRDAWTLSRSFETTDHQGNIYLCYLGKRWLTILLIAITILYLISGQLSSLLYSFFKLFEGAVS